MILKNKKAVIGMIHLLPTIGYRDFISKENILDRAIEDLNILESKGVDAIIIENNYDIPHKIKVEKETLVLIGEVLGEIRKRTRIPLGLNILWNDYESSLSLAKIYDCEFVRIPVFVDHVITSFGEVIGEPDRVIEFRKRIGAENIQIFVDIQVKHAELVNKRPIGETALEAIEKGADGLIITGKWTGDAPDLEKLKEVYKIAGSVPVIIGSGVDKDNIKSLFEFADASIVSTSLKEGEKKSKDEERNIKPYSARIDPEKVEEFMNEVRTLRRNNG